MGNFVHIELNSKDAAGAKAFYTKVFGWKTIDMPMEGMTYTMVEEMMNPGIGMQGVQDPNAPSHWLPYVEVDDVHNTVAAATSAGGQALLPHMEVKGPDGSVMGEIAILSDPSGALFGIWMNRAPAPEAQAEAPEAAPKKKATKKKAAKKKATKKKATKKKAAAKKRPAKKVAKKKVAKKKATKKKAAAKKRPAKKVAKKKAAKKRPAKKAAKKKAAKKKAATKKRPAKKAATKKRPAKKAAKKRASKKR
ncbi:MAG: VOC family protein [Deltaproteobacteria bacterium]